MYTDCSGRRGRVVVVVEAGVVVVVVRQRAEDKVCLVHGVAGRVRRMRVPRVCVGVCVRVRVRVGQGERRLDARAAGPSGRVYRLRVVQGKLRARGWLGVRRKGGRAAHHHVGVASR